MLFGAGVLFIGYEGFGLVTNAAGDMRNPRVMLPRALYTSVILVIIIYLAVSVTVSGNLSDAQIEQARDYALAEAAKPFLGEFGFRLIAIAALFSTASAINATLFGSANVCYMIARDGELPARLSRTEWKQATGGLLLTAALVVLVTLCFDLSGIAMMGSAAFLLVYAAVNAGHLRVLKQTGGERHHRLAVAAHLPRDVRHPRRLHLPAAAGRASLRWSPLRRHHSPPSGPTGGGPGGPSKRPSLSGSAAGPHPLQRGGAPQRLAERAPGCRQHRPRCRQRCTNGCVHAGHVKRDPVLAVAVRGRPPRRPVLKSRIVCLALRRPCAARSPHPRLRRSPSRSAGPTSRSRRPPRGRHGC